MRIKSYKQMKREKTREETASYFAQCFIVVIALTPFVFSLNLIANLLTR